MTDFLTELPLVLVLGALVCIFVSLRGRNKSPRLILWLIGWVIMTLHFLLDMFQFPQDWANRAMDAAQVAALAVCGLAFAISVAELNKDRRWRWGLFGGFSALFIAYSVLLAWESRATAAYVVLAIAVYAPTSVMFAIWHRRVHGYEVLMGLLVLAFGVDAILRIVHQDFGGGYYSMLLGIYALAGVLVVRCYRRLSPGVALTSVGFFSWAAVWGMSMLAPAILDKVGVSSELWNVPKIFVAFGMILMELEDRSLAAQQAEVREHALSRQLGRFSDLTSRLLGGVEIRSFCGEVAETLVDVSNYRSALVLLADELGRLGLAGHAGLDLADLQELREQISGVDCGSLEQQCAMAHPLGAKSFLCPADYRIASGQAGRFDGKPRNSGDQVLVPLRSPQGNMVGCISLLHRTAAAPVMADEVAAVEMLAGDLGVAIEKASLQQKVMLQEKLASIGQLVSGVAHELNNPLTVVIGYSELMEEADTEHRYQRELSTMRREALRMRAIIDNLLRFARQSRSETKTARVEQAVMDAVALREYEFQRGGITIEREIGGDLPAVVIDEAQLKTVMVHLMSNACDAVQLSDEKRISVHARRVGERVLISVLDSGPGFKDVTRAFDPFFSTKGLGHGPGLGLSICYGIVKQHGGEVYAQNVYPRGAGVTMELQVARETPRTQVEAASPANEAQ